MLHLHVPEGRGRLPWEVMSPQSGSGAGRGLLQGKLLPTQLLSLFPAAPHVEPDLGKGLEC